MIELFEQRKAKTTEIERLTNLIETEKRGLTDEETNSVTKLRTEIMDIDKEIETRKSKNNNIKMEKFNLLKAINNQANGRLQSDEVLQIVEAGKRAFSDANVSTRGSILLPMEYRAGIAANATLGGQEFTPEDKLDIVGALRANSVIFQAGARFLTGLKGDVSIPVYAGTSSLWASEISGATDGAGATSEITMTPKKLTTFIDVSKLSLNQSSASLEQLLYDDIVNSVMEKLEASIFDTTAADETRPAGIFNSASYTFSGTTTFAGAVSLETKLATDKALRGKLAYFVSPKVAEKFKVTAQFTSGNTPIMGMDGKVNTYPVYSTTHLPVISGAASGVCFMNADDLLIGQWGGLDITVDNYTRAIYGQVRLVIVSYWSWAKRRSTSVSYGAFA